MIFVALPRDSSSLSYGECLNTHNASLCIILICFYNLILQIANICCFYSAGLAFPLCSIPIVSEMTCSLDIYTCFHLYWGTNISSFNIELNHVLFSFDSCRRKNSQHFRSCSATHLAVHSSNTELQLHC